jgi:hypothetical protein
METERVRCLHVDEAIAISNRPLQVFHNSALVRSWSAAVPSSTGAEQLAVLAARHALPAIYPFRE